MDKISMIIEEFKNEKSGENVEGITILIDGKLKEVVDIIKLKENQERLVNIIHESLLIGLEIISKR